MTDAPASPVSRRAVLGGAGLGAGLAAASPVLWLPPGAYAGGKASGVHLTYGTDARTSMTVSWSTARSVKAPRLEVGPDKGLGRHVVANSRPTKDLKTIYHHATVRGLEPGERYFYRITQHGGAPATGTFLTAPDEVVPFRFAAFGDMGVNTAAARHVRLIDDMNPDLAFVVGDLCYADSSGGTGAGGPETQDFRTWDDWLTQIQSNAARRPWMTTVGNHEMEADNGELGYAGYLDRFRLPGNGVEGAPVTYSFVYSNVAFIALDGNDASFEISRNEGYLGAKQDDWLKAQLKAFRKRDDIDFIVVGFHNCMYCTNLVHSSDGGNRTRWEHLFDRYSVDLVVNGHNHCYERTHPLRAGDPVVEAPRGAVVDSSKGTTYLTAGGAGQAVYPTSGSPLAYVTMDGGVRVPEATLWSALVDNSHSIGFVDVKPRRGGRPAEMKLTALATNGSVIDKVTLQRGS